MKSIIAKTIDFIYFIKISEMEDKFKIQNHKFKREVFDPKQLFPKNIILKLVDSHCYSLIITDWTSHCDQLISEALPRYARSWEAIAIVMT
jgi:hypothetical protein